MRQVLLLGFSTVVRTPSQMDMREIYQPVMLKVLLQNHGTASVAQIAKAFFENAVLASRRPLNFYG
jgi:hypothetical protein